MSVSWAFMDKVSPLDPKEGAAVGGALYGLSPFIHKDMAVITKFVLIFILMKYSLSHFSHRLKKCDILTPHF
jgi:hypothetical protein